jgi:uncharacterized protein YceK
MKKIFIFLLVGLVLQGCQTPAHELKSPCVGTEGSPCGDRRKVNDWWINAEA